jgi:hypothetical protein
MRRAADIAVHRLEPPVELFDPVVSRPLAVQEDPDRAFVDGSVDLAEPGQYLPRLVGQ